MDTDLLFILTSVCFFLWTFRSIFYWLEAWQRVDYKPQDIVSNVFIKRRFIRYFFSPTSLVTWGSIGAALYISISDIPIEWYQLLILGVFCIKASIVLIGIIKNSVVKAKINLRSSMIMLISFLILLLLFMFPLTEKYLWLLVIDRLKMFVVGGVISLFVFPSEIYEDIVFRRAVSKLQNFKKIKIILFVGDGNAEITKWYTSKFLKKIGRVLVAPESQNVSDLAHFINKSLTQEHKFLLLTLSSLKDEKLISFVQSLSIDTCVWTNTITDSKHKLIQGRIKVKKLIIPEELFIQDRTYVKGNKIILLSTKQIEKEIPHTSNVCIQNLSEHKNITKVELLTNIHEYILVFPFVSSIHTQAALLAVIVAYHEGLTKKEIEKTSKDLFSYPHTLTQHLQRNGDVVIDNTSVFALLFLKDGMKIMSKMKKKKVIILGVEDTNLTKNESTRIGDELKGKADYVILLNSNNEFNKHIRKTLHTKSNSTLVMNSNEKKALQFFQDHESNSVYFFHGQKAQKLCERTIASFGSTA